MTDNRTRTEVIADTMALWEDTSDWDRRLRAGEIDRALSVWERQRPPTDALAALNALVKSCEALYPKGMIVKWAALQQAKAALVAARDVRGQTE